MATIPPIIGAGKRNIWLDVAQACRDANLNSFHLFDDWQRGSDRYDKADSKSWPRGLKQPSNGSWLSLLRHAKLGDRNWWQRNPEVWEWWRLNAALHHAETTSSDDAETTGFIQELCHSIVMFHAEPWDGVAGQEAQAMPRRLCRRRGLSYVPLPAARMVQGQQHSGTR